MELGEIYESAESDVYLNLSPPPPEFCGIIIFEQQVHTWAARDGIFSSGEQQLDRFVHTSIISRWNSESRRTIINDGDKYAGKRYCETITPTVNVAISSAALISLTIIVR